MSKAYSKKQLPAYFDYKDVENLKRYIDSYGQIMPRSATGLTAKLQSQLAREVKRARHLALLPFVNAE
ncbi:MAG: 30S ribosomal protein S18 [Candidatus Nomurabacteria bacterium]|jgi:small subunit ribosomal protein S18|nr:30S ribosomal protein S18 [Candidatus Nomurabacteria bacterium]